ncbi:6413_t:CDS:2, partial [Racocetra fulgida]
MTTNDGPIAKEKPSVSKEEMESLKQYLIGIGARIYNEYDSVIMKGFAVEMPEEIATALSEDKNVELVEPDQT